MLVVWELRPDVSPDDLRALVRRHIEDGFNRGDWTVCETTLADDYTAYYGAEGKANVGRDHYVMVCKMLRKSFPDVRSRSRTSWSRATRS